MTVAGAWNGVRSSLSVTAGNWYWEYTITGAGGGNILLGVGRSSATLGDYVGADANGW